MKHRIAYPFALVYPDNMKIGKITTKTIAVCGMFAAIGIILGYLTIPVSDSLRIGFSGLANQCVYVLYGPGLGCIFGAALDVLKYLIKPTGPYIPGLTFNAFLAGLIYGFSFYRKKLTFRRILITEFCVCLICNVLLGTFWLYLTYGKSVMVTFPIRVLKNAVQFPINALLFFLIYKNVLSKRGIENV